ncbi:heme A synthase [Nordella sp. HKS 07]|uniref:COX15/CtaA family protein n=1 Tax=Nordella sp. HKS 07 TaxID=2712222 RepID=UPI0013E1878E|nr:COX15/CtaA family protein [Nordella sp. HKS 07]QIG50931.1 heme A synthase [Nordella sp. HKS 07]
MTVLTERQLKARPYIRAWLWIAAALVLAMVIVGGATRLTDSGLSITEWQPLLGAIPPLGEVDWLAAFEKYKLIPEYTLVNKGMSLAEFKFIYWWEWAHRFLGRFIGLVMILPFLFFWLSRRIEPRLTPRLVVLISLGGLQGALGWYMVKSGLVERVDVSQHRLAAHLTLATVILGAIVWTALGVGHARREPPRDKWGWAAFGLVGLVLLQVAAGGFVAGLDAGMGYNTWPLMDGQWIPAGLLIMEPWWRNLFENAMTVQFDHRLIAYAVAIYAALYAWRVRSRPACAVLVAVLLQIGLGIWALLKQVPLDLGLAHQGGAMIVFAATIWAMHEALSRQPATRFQPVTV